MAVLTTDTTLINLSNHVLRSTTMTNYVVKNVELTTEQHDRLQGNLTAWLV
ncbi:hypothetical protein BRC2024_AWKCSVWU_CDS_0040 [Acinetobacter phage vB_AbaP_ABW132]